jgi:predicted  nucleic acid-binding Zn-ribbon protein
MADDFVSIRREIQDLRNEHSKEVQELRTHINSELGDIRGRQQHYADLHNELEKKMIAIQSDMQYLRKGQDSLNKNLSTFLWLMGGGFITTFLAWALKGGMLGG